MIVPEHWAEAARKGRVADRAVTLRRFGWSDVSVADAEALARTRLDEAWQRLERGERPARREPKVPYNGAEGVPIREEIVQRRGADVVTRNSYGALCLNTPDVLFADVDFDVPARARFACGSAVVGALAFGALGVQLGGRITWLAGVVVGLLLGPTLLAGLTSLWTKLNGGPERLALRRIERLVARHADWRLDVYRTPVGLRVVAAHAVFDPAGDEARAIFQALHTDRVYRAMCARQRCFRARLTAKPWRIGIQGHLRPRPGVWPVHPDRRADRAAWLADYDRTASGYAACRYERTLGLGAEHPRAAAVRALHDELARARAGLPIA